MIPPSFAAALAVSILIGTLGQARAQTPQPATADHFALATANPAFSSVAFILREGQSEPLYTESSGALIDACHVLTVGHAVLPMANRTEKLATGWPKHISVFFGMRAAPTSRKLVESSLQNFRASFATEVSAVPVASGVLRMETDQEHARADWAILELTPCVTSIRPFRIRDGVDPVTPLRLSMLGYPGDGKFGMIYAAENCAASSRADLTNADDLYPADRFTIIDDDHIVWETVFDPELSPRKNYTPHDRGSLMTRCP